MTRSIAKLPSLVGLPKMGRFCPNFGQKIASEIGTSICPDFEFLLYLNEYLAAKMQIVFVSDSLQSRLPHPDRPKCNSILHLCGSWLFEAAFIGSQYSKHPFDQVPIARPMFLYTVSV